MTTDGSAAAFRLNTPITRNVPTTCPSGPTSTTSTRCIGTWRWTVLTSAVRTIRTGWSGRAGVTPGSQTGGSVSMPRATTTSSPTIRQHPSRTKLSSSSHSRRSAPSATSSAG